MIPIIELHDATGEWQKLSMLVDYWTRPDVLEVLKNIRNISLSILVMK